MRPPPPQSDVDDSDAVRLVQHLRARLTRSPAKRLAGFIGLAVALATPNLVAGQESLRVRGFAEVGAQMVSGDEPASFFLGQYDMYTSGVLSDKLDFLSEIVIEFEDEAFIDLERLWVRYALTDQLSLSGGKFHTPIGYWNRAYHHGGLIQPSLERPLIMAFEDEGGQFPVHTTGVLLEGSNLGSAEFGFELMVSNGLGAPTAEDNNSGKAVSGRVSARPSTALNLGASMYRETIRAGTDRPDESALPEDVEQTIFGFDVQAGDGPFDLWSEVVWSKSEAEGAAEATTTWGYFAIGAFAATDRLSPYVKVDERRIGAADPYYVGPDVRMLAAGVRYDLSIQAALKAELRQTSLGEGFDDVTALYLRVNIGW